MEPTPAEVEARKENRRAYDRQRAQNPERKEQHRLRAIARRNEAKSIGLCVNCWAPPIPDETRCENCAENKRKYRWDAKARKTQARIQQAGQARFL